MQCISLLLFLKECLLSVNMLAFLFSLSYLYENEKRQYINSELHGIWFNKLSTVLINLRIDYFFNVTLTTEWVLNR